MRHLLLRNEQLCKSFEMVTRTGLMWTDWNTEVVNQVVKKPTSEMDARLSVKLCCSRNWSIWRCTLRTSAPLASMPHGEANKLRCSEELLKEFDSIRDAWHERQSFSAEEWLSFLFTCENQLMLALLQEKHFQASNSIASSGLEGHLRLGAVGGLYPGQGLRWDEPQARARGFGK